MQKLEALLLYFTHSIKLPFRFTIKKVLEWHNMNVISHICNFQTCPFDLYFLSVAYVWVFTVCSVICQKKVPKYPCMQHTAKGQVSENKWANCNVFPVNRTLASLLAWTKRSVWLLLHKRIFFNYSQHSHVK